MDLTPFTREQLRALRDLVTLWGPDAFALIGASALKCFLPMSWRLTHDLDLAVSLSPNEFPAGLETLPGWRRHPDLEHEWRSADAVRVDIVPSDEALVEKGEIVWPRSNFRMSLVGFDLVFRHARRIDIADDLRIQVAPVPVVAVLKIVAYGERPFEREKDLADLAYVLEHYLSEDDERRFSDEVFDWRLIFEEAAAFCLGRDVGAIAGKAERQAVEAFVAMVRNEEDSRATLARMLRLGPRTWRNDPAELIGRLRAFEMGLQDR